MDKEFIIEFEAEGIDADCMQGIFEDGDILCLADDVKEQLISMYGDKLKWFVISKNSVNGTEDIYDSRKKHYDVTIHMCFDPEDLDEEDFMLEADNLEDAKECIKNDDNFKNYNYYVIEGIDNDDYYNSSEEPDFIDRC